MKKIITIILSAIITLSIGCICVAASNDIPSDLPAGTIKITDGIYAYTPEVSINGYLPWTNIGTVPALGTIVQPSALRYVSVSTSENYLRLQCSKSIKINLVYGTQSVFGANCTAWPTIGGNRNTQYFIEADYYNITKGVYYQMQCTSSNDFARTSTEITFTTTP